MSFPPTSLINSVRTVPVLPGHDHKLSYAEDLILQTSVLKRMRKLRQMGLAYHEYPLAEHTRYVHSIGTSYWAVQMFDGLTCSTGALLQNNIAVLREMRSVLGEEISLELVLRLYSLIHDIGLLPLGHTLKIQTRRFTGPDFSFVRLFSRSISEILCEIEEIDISRDVKISLKKHLAIAEAVAHAPRIIRGELSDFGGTLYQRVSPAELMQKLPVLCFAYDLVHGVCAADLLDWCHRDVPAIGIQNGIPTYPFSAGAAIRVEPGQKAFPVEETHSAEPVFRYGLDCRETSGWGCNALFRLVGLHKLRVDVILRGNYTGKKVVADAVLDKSIRVIEKTTGEPIEAGIPFDEILTMGDDEFLEILERKLDALEQSGEMKALKNFHNFQKSIAIGEADFGADFGNCLDKLARSDERSALESSLAQFLNVRFEDVIISAPPRNMQGKVPDTIVRVGDSEWQPVWMSAAKSYLMTDFANLKNSYKDGRQISVFLRHGTKFELNALHEWLRKALRKRDATTYANPSPLARKNY